MFGAYWEVTNKLDKPTLFSYFVIIANRCFFNHSSKYKGHTFGRLGDLSISDWLNVWEILSSSDDDDDDDEFTETRTMR